MGSYHYDKIYIETKEGKKIIEVVVAAQLAGKALDAGWNDIDMELNDTKLKIKCRRTN